MPQHWDIGWEYLSQYRHPVPMPRDHYRYSSDVDAGYRRTACLLPVERHALPGTRSDLVYCCHANGHQQNYIHWSALSRWENNKIDIRFNLVIKLLDNIHINLKEFTNYCKINHSNPFVAKVAMYYEANDDRHILQLIQSKKKEYQNSHNQFDLLLLAIACNCY